VQEPGDKRQVVVRGVALACCVGLAALLSEAADWRPWWLVVALAGVMALADVVAISTRHIRVSAGLMVQTTAMALLGTAPAVGIGVGAAAIESRHNRVRLTLATSNMLIVAVLALVGGVLFEVLGDHFGLDRDDPGYALLVVPVYAVVMVLNVVLVIALHPHLAREQRRRIPRDSVLPALPLEFVKGLIAAAAVLAAAYSLLAAVAGLLFVLLVTIPLGRMLENALVSDERAAEVASLASDRDRLVVEVLNAEDRERAHLAESLHDGPMQRLMALRQDVGDGTSREALAAHLDRTIAETRAIISAFHPASVHALGFAASLRAAVEPFPGAAAVELLVAATVDDHALAGSLAMPVARELVVNAVKHADPTRIDVTVREEPGQLVLEVSDDGVGIDSGQADRAVQAGHVGLAMVRRRVEDAGGQLAIATRPDGGTHSRVVLPASSGH
jgi:signal transduction histidine kinase